MLHTESFGNGPDIIFLHGLFGAGDNWRSIGKSISEQYRVHLIDLPNHGRSSWMAEPSLPNLANTINDWIIDNDIQHYTLLGHSLGGKVAMQMALNHPVNQLQKLVIADISPKIYPPHHQAIFDALKSVNFSEAKDRKAVDKHLKPQIPIDGIRLFLLKSLYKKEGQLAWRFNLEVLENRYECVANAPTSVEAFKLPTLFIKGQNSDYIIPEDEALIRPLFPNATAKIIEGTGHWLHAEKPDVFTRILTQFIES